MQDTDDERVIGSALELVEAHAVRSRFSFARAYDQFSTSADGRFALAHASEPLPSEAFRGLSSVGLVALDCEPGGKDTCMTEVDVRNFGQAPREVLFDNSGTEWSCDDDVSKQFTLRVLQMRGMPVTMQLVGEHLVVLSESVAPTAANTTPAMLIEVVNLLSDEAHVWPLGAAASQLLPFTQDGLDPERGVVVFGDAAGVRTLSRWSLDDLTRFGPAPNSAVTLAGDIARVQLVPPHTCAGGPRDTCCQPRGMSLLVGYGAGGGALVDLATLDVHAFETSAQLSTGVLDAARGLLWVALDDSRLAMIDVLRGESQELPLMAAASRILTFDDGENLGAVVHASTLGSVTWLQRPNSGPAACRVQATGSRKILLDQLGGEGAP